MNTSRRPAASPETVHGTASGGRFSDELERWLSDGEQTLGSLVDAFAEKSFAVLLVLLLAVPALPLPTGGVTHVFELIALLLALELITGRREVWLPQRWRRLMLTGQRQQRFIAKLLSLIRRLERVSRPRMTWLFHRRLSDAAFGLLVIAGTLGAFLAPPFSGLDTLPALGVVVLALAVLLGEVVRGRRALAAETAQRQRAAQEERDAEAARRVAEERLRIARDLHDTVAHSMATITVQAGSALHLLGGQDGNLRAALTAIRETSKEALREMRGTLGQLRGDGQPSGGQAGQAGLDRLPSLQAAVAAAGAPVTISVEGSQRALPADVDQAAYRILQEALTNVLRHAGPSARAAVQLCYRPDELAIRVTDDGGAGNGSSPVSSGSGDGGAGGGHGLTGRAERAAAAGGEVTAGPLAGGGFEVTARLPLPPGGGAAAGPSPAGRLAGDTH